MLTLVVLTAGFLAVTLMAALVAILVFAMQISRFTAETSAALDVVGEGAGRLGRHLERIQRVIEAAASELDPAET